MKSRRGKLFSLKLNVGHFPHLVELVTRINYDYFYMLENGNLIMAPGSETASSWGKPLLANSVTFFGHNHDEF
ncbi:hypothetical protein RHMOL_Rhmol05G0215300 [Rhododendron molle]|uniref:Uncharacterized protein n=1 Tax=Rhododendron molle TaxID=49168 RepID=A0ACC0NT68_RHOML|nr:hypothetical protein RHMOL_Rhmol05G0215300 [Rhododendron molle]